MPSRSPEVNNYYGAGGMSISAYSKERGNFVDWEGSGIYFYFILLHSLC